MNSQTKRKIISKIREKAKRLGLEVDESGFIVNFLPPRDVAILDYLNGKPSYYKFGHTGSERIKNFNKFMTWLKTKNFGKSQGSASNDKRQLMMRATLLPEGANRSKIIHIINKLKVDKTGNAVLVARNPKREIDYDVTFHEWIHVLLRNNKIGFYDTGGKRGYYNEGLTICIEYYLGNYFERDLNFLKSLLQQCKHPKRSSYEFYLTYAQPFFSIVESKKTPAQKKLALKGYFERISAPKKARY